MEKVKEDETMKKKLVGAACAVAACFVLLCGCGKDAGSSSGSNDPKHLQTTTLQITNAEAKPGDTVTLDVSLAESSDMWGFSWEVNYDATVMTPVDVVMSDAYNTNFEMTINKTANPLVLQGAGREIQNYSMKGQVAQLTFRIAENAASGDYHVNVGCKEGNNIDVDANDIPFTPVTATVTVKA